MSRSSKGKGHPKNKVIQMSYKGHGHLKVVHTWMLSIGEYGPKVSLPKGQGQGIIKLKQTSSLTKTSSKSNRRMNI